MAAYRHKMPSVNHWKSYWLTDLTDTDMKLIDTEILI